MQAMYWVSCIYENITAILTPLCKSILMHPIQWIFMLVTILAHWIKICCSLAFLCLALLSQIILDHIINFLAVKVQQNNLINVTNIWRICCSKISITLCLKVFSSETLCELDNRKYLKFIQQYCFDFVISWLL